MTGTDRLRPRRSYDEHPGLQWLRSSDAGRAWLSALPRLVDECSQRWSLSVGEPFTYAHASLALPVVLPDRTDGVLKIQFPHHESEHEAAALVRWAGNGAVRLFAFDPDRHALLLERCRPGTPLAQVESDEALAVLGELVARLSLPAGPPFAALSDEAARWAASLARARRGARSGDQALIDAALDYLDFLPSSQRAQVLIHQDLHAANVLRSERLPWLVIDPKPLVGEPEFSVASIVRGDELGHGPEQVRRRLDVLVAELGLDHERARGWTVAQTLAWAVDDHGLIAEHLEVAAWLLHRS